jgi:hypothetical protein
MLLSLYDKDMKLLALFAALVLSMFGAGVDTEAYKTVYILPMANSLDQFLAIKLTTGVVIQVVTDAHKADAIFTDRIGVGFEQKLDEIYGGKPKDADDSQDGTVRKPVQAITRGKGAIFLVDPKTRNVIWSDYEHPKNTSPEEMNRLAERIAGRLEKARKGK